jgi:hypothetical protein
MKKLAPHHWIPLLLLLPFHGSQGQITDYTLMPNSPAYRLADQFHKQGKLLIEK